MQGAGMEPEGHFILCQTEFKLPLAGLKRHDTFITLGDPESNKPKEEKPVSDVAENQPIKLINPNEGSIQLC